MTKLHTCLNFGGNSEEALNQGNNVYISVHPASKEEADRIFNALSL